MGKKKRRWSQDPRELLRADAGFDLAAFDRAGTPGFKGKKKDGDWLIAERGALLSELQERLFAHGRAGGQRRLLCVFQGLDTAGKGGIVRHVMGMVDPQGVALRAFGVPTAEERKHDYLWRIRKALPGPGLIGVFDRSHYEDVLVVRVDELVPKDVWEKRYDEINDFEKELTDSGTVVLKFALMVDHDEQGVRLMERLDRPDKRWKFSDNDLKTRAKWDAYQQAYQAVLDRTSTAHAPWYVIPANRKWFSHLAVTEIVTQTMIEMGLDWPVPDWDPAAMREQLASLMSPKALQISLADTEKVVSKALRKNTAVEAQSLDTALADDPEAPVTEQMATQTATGSALKEEAKFRAELAGTLDQKLRLLAAASDEATGTTA